MAVALAVAIVGALAGCPRPQEPRPVDVVRTFADALDRGDFDAAYALMTSEYRATTGRAEFERYLASDPGRIPALVATLRSARPEETRYEAVLLRGEDGDDVRLVDPAGEGRWLLDGEVLTPWPQSTPREALRSFVRALEQERYDVLLRFSPERYRAHMDEAALRAEMGADPDGRATLLANLKEALENEIIVGPDGRTAVMRYARFQVDFVLEDGLWRIEDPD